MQMLTVIESPLFAKDWPDYWDAAEYEAFVTHIAANPESGDVVPGTGGCRKVRWSRPGMGKRGGTRVVYLTHQADGSLVLLLIYGKAARENIAAHVLREIARELGHGNE